MTATLVTAPPYRADWEAVARLLRDSFAYMEPLLGYPHRAAALTTTEMARAVAQGAVFLMIDRDAPAVCLFTRPSRDFSDALYCGWLAVAASHRGHGLARQLLFAAEGHAADLGFDALTLDTGTALTDLHARFVRLGFDRLPDTGATAPFRKPLPRRCGPDDPCLPAVLVLLRDSFAYMDGRIDPPSSLTRMGLDTLRAEAAENELWLIAEAGRPIACMILTPRSGTLYLGKIATARSHRGAGLARRLVAQAEARARALGLASLTLQTRIELTENHAAFRALGFAETGRTAHPGFDRPTSLTFTRSL